jgi:hypothetical protein
MFCGVRALTAGGLGRPLRFFVTASQVGDITQSAGSSSRTDRKIVLGQLARNVPPYDGRSHVRLSLTFNEIEPCSLSFWAVCKPSLKSRDIELPASSSFRERMASPIARCRASSALSAPGRAN